MKVSIPKISGKKYFHELSHENTTTTHWGQVQPLMVNERAAKDKITLRVGQSVFLTPMAKPTFGRMSIKTYNCFVPISDIWHPFDSFLSGQTYHGSDANYIPLDVPQVPQGLLTAYVLLNADVFCYYGLPAAITQVNFDSVSFSPDLQHVGESEKSDIENSFYGLLRSMAGETINFADSQNRQDFKLNFHHIDFPEDFDADAFDFVLATDEVSGTDHTYFYFVRLNQSGRNLRKILLGCGYQLNFQTDPVSLLPLFAYYKAYFDLFNIARSKTWKETFAYAFMERIEQHNLALAHSWVHDADTFTLFRRFFSALRFCYYTQNPDYVSAHISGTATPISSRITDSFEYLNPDSRVGHTTLDEGTQPAVIPDAFDSVNQTALNVLRKMYYRVNASTAIGGRIKAFLRAFYGNTEFDQEESNFIGSQRIDVQISQLMNMAETSEAYLGQYAARGDADGQGRTFTFECREQGFVVVLAAAVPETRYAQAVDPNLRHLRKYDFFTPDFDSITLLPTPKYNIYGNEEVYTNKHVQSLSGGFGNIPNYMEYKTKYNILNGDMSLGSKRNSYLPFTLNKLLPFKVFSHTAAFTRVGNLSSDLLVAGDVWRYIGRDSWLGWFNRIFINSGTDDIINTSGDHRGNYDDLEDIDDNFIVYNYIDYKVSSFAKAVKSSFETVESGDSFDIEKA